MFVTTFSWKSIKWVTSSAMNLFKSRKVVQTIERDTTKLDKSNLLKANAAKGKRAEICAEQFLGSDALYNKHCFRFEDIVPRSVKKHSRPDYIKDNVAYEVKSNDINKNAKGLIDKVVEQIKRGTENLPKTMKQKVIIGITEQKVTTEAFDAVNQRIVEKCEGILTKDGIPRIGEYVK